MNKKFFLIPLFFLFILLVVGRISLFQTRYRSNPKFEETTYDRRNVSLIPVMKDYRFSFTLNEINLEYTFKYPNLNIGEFIVDTGDSTILKLRGNYKTTELDEKSGLLLIQLDQDNEITRAILKDWPKDIIINPNRTFIIKEI